MKIGANLKKIKTSIESLKNTNLNISKDIVALTKVEEIKINDFFESVNIDISKSLIYKKGSHIYGYIVSNGSTTSSASGTIKIGTIKEKYRPFIRQNCGALYNPSTSGQTYNPAMVSIQEWGWFGVVIDKINANVGNNNYPWTTSDGVFFNYEI